MSDIIKYNKIDVNKIIFSKPKPSDWTTTQNISYINYDQDNNRKLQLKIQTPEIYYEAGGIPKLHEKTKSEEERRYIKIPFCHERKKYGDKVNYDEIKILYDNLLEIDKKCGSQEFREEMFDKNHNQYFYQPIVRIPDPDEEPKLDKNGNPFFQFPYFKGKLPFNYNDSTIPEFKVLERVDDKRVQVEIKSLDDVEKYIVWQSKYRLIISFSKLYAMKSKGGKDKKAYGIILKITCIEVQRPANSITSKSSDAFIDSDDEVEDDKNKKEVITRKKDINQSEDEEENPVSQNLDIEY